MSSLLEEARGDGIEFYIGRWAFEMFLVRTPRSGPSFLNVGINLAEVGPGAYRWVPTWNEQG